MDISDFKNLDDKSKREIIITAGMILIFVVVLGNSVKTIMKKRGSVTPKPAAVAAPSGAGSLDLATTALQDVSQQAVPVRTTTYYKQIESLPWGRDPFTETPFGHEGYGAISGLTLEGILWDNVEPTAIINGEIVGVGERVGAASVIRIEPDYVLVTDGEKQYKLQLW